LFPVGGCVRWLPLFLRMCDQDSVSSRSPPYPISSALDEGTCLSYRFDLVEEEHLWLQHLHEEGYVVIKAVADSSQVTETIDLFWQDLEQTRQISRRKPKTWKTTQFGLSPDLSQSAGAWSVRGLPSVKLAFQQIWKTSDLLVSMDCVIVWLPWWLNPLWRPGTEGLHLDQNPFSKPNLECIQGMVPLLDVTHVTGGLQVVPRSHLPDAKEQLKVSHDYLERRGDWCPLGNDFDDDAKLVLAHAGDLILWDSRTIHGGLVGTGVVPATDPSGHPPELARLSCCVAMTARSRADEATLAHRLKAVRNGLCLNHTPHEAGTSTGTLETPKLRRYRPIHLSEDQRALI